MVPILEKFGKLRRALNLTFTQDLRPLGIGPKQAVLLRYLANHGEGSLAELSRATVTDPAAVNRSAAVLLKRGLLQRQEHATDRRRWRVSLTAKGRTLVGQVEDIYAGVARSMVAPLTPKERELLSLFFDRMLEPLAGAVRRKR